MPKDDEQNDYTMSEKRLKQICKERGHYQTPYLNDILYFHYLGFRKIENLEPYTGCKALWLEGNGLAKIEGLDTMTQLTCLYLQENIISKIENLDKLVNLRQLNLSNNCIQIIDNLQPLQQLETLYLASNRISCSSALKGLIGLDKLQILDISKNQIDDEGFVEIMEQIPDLKVLDMQGNPVYQKMKLYRKTVVRACQELTYLDDRPVFNDERRATVAYFKGGADAEIQERRLILAEKRADDAAQFAGMQAFLSGKSREESNKLSEEARQEVLKRFHETGEIDKVEKVDKIREIGLRGDIWDIKQVETVSREFFEKQCGVEIVNVEAMNYQGDYSDAEGSDVPELEKPEESSEEAVEINKAVKNDENDAKVAENNTKSTENVTSQVQNCTTKDNIATMTSLPVTQQDTASTTENINEKQKTFMTQPKFEPGEFIDVEKAVEKKTGETAVKIDIQQEKKEESEKDSDSEMPD